MNKLMSIFLSVVPPQYACIVKKKSKYRLIFMRVQKLSLILKCLHNNISLLYLVIPVSNQITVLLIITQYDLIMQNVITQCKM